MVIKNLENKIKLVMIVSCLFMVGCIIISLGSGRQCAYPGAAHNDG